MKKGTWSAVRDIVIIICIITLTVGVSTVGVSIARSLRGIDESVFIMSCNTAHGDCK